MSNYKQFQMNRAEPFLEALDRKARMLAPAARASYEANKDLCSWLLNPLARWAEAAYGETVFEEAARGYASYCLGVAQAQRIYEKAGRYTPEAMPEIMSGVYEDEGYMVPYMWAAILIYAFLALDDKPSRFIPEQFPATPAAQRQRARTRLRTWCPQFVGCRGTAGHAGRRGRH